jgi:hypothetical protein
VTVTETATVPPSSPGQASPTPTVKLTWPTAPVTVPFKGCVPPVPQLLAIRVGGHPSGGYDRVALEFNKLPGYSVKYEAEVV